MMFYVQRFQKKYSKSAIRFLKQGLPESGRTLDLDGRHKIYGDIDRYFECFWLLFDKKMIVGTVALKKIDNTRCELKALYLLELYLLENFQEMGLGRMLLETSINEAKKQGYCELFFDTLSTSEKAIRLYKKAGFIMTERYNENEFADVFMVLKLKQNGKDADRL